VGPRIDARSSALLYGLLIRCLRVTRGWDQCVKAYPA
jgi:hypothetical protein